MSVRCGAMQTWAPARIANYTRSLVLYIIFIFVAFVCSIVQCIWFMCLLRGDVQFVRVLDAFYIHTHTELMYAGNASHEPFFISFKTSIHSTALAMQSCIDACSLSLSLRTNRTMWPLTYPSRHCMCHHQLVHLLARMRQCVVDRNARIFKHFSTFLFSFHSSSYSTTAIRTSCSRRQIRLVRTDISSFARPAISYWAHVHTPDRMFSRRCRNYDRH